MDMGLALAGLIKDAVFMNDKSKSLWQRLFGDSVRAFGSVSLISCYPLLSPPQRTSSASGGTTSMPTSKSSAIAATQTLCSATSVPALSKSGSLNSE